MAARPGALLTTAGASFWDGRRWGIGPIRSDRRVVCRPPFRCGDCGVVRSRVLEFQAERWPPDQYRDRHRDPNRRKSQFAPEPSGERVLVLYPASATVTYRSGHRSTDRRAEWTTARTARNQLLLPASRRSAKKIGHNRSHTPRSQVAMGAVLEIFAGFIVIGLLSGVVTSLLLGLTSRRAPR